MPLRNRTNAPAAGLAVCWVFAASLGGALVSCGPEPRAETPRPPATTPAAVTAIVPIPEPTATAAPAEEPSSILEPRCSSAGYCWESPLLPVGRLSAGWAAGPNDVYVVGPGALMLHFDGAEWRAERTGVKEDLVAVWGSGPDDVYATSIGGSVLRRRGGVWSRVLHESGEIFTAVWGTGAEDVFAARTGGVVFHFDGRQWTSQVIGSGTGVGAIWGSGPKDVYAVGADGDAGAVLHYDGSTWKAHGRLGKSLCGVWGTGPDKVWVAGTDEHDQLAVWRLAGSQWKAEKVPAGGVAGGLSGAGGKPVLLSTTEIAMEGPLPFWKRTQSVFAIELVGNTWTRRELLSVSPSQVYGGYDFALFGDAKGTAYVAGGWSVLGSLGPKGFQGLLGNDASGKDLTGVWGTGPSDVVAVGMAGALLHYDGKAWTLDPAGNGYSFTGIHGAKDMLVASALGGKLLVREKGKWADLKTGSSKDLLAVWTNGEDIFAGGEDGTMVHCKKGRCTRMKTGIEEDSFFQIWGRSPTDVYAVTDPAGLFHWDGAKWQAQLTPWDPKATVIDPNQGRDHHDDGGAHFAAIGPDDRGGMLVETNDKSYRLANGTWTRLGEGGAYALTDGSSGDIRAVYGGSDVGTPTRVRRFDGQRWHDEPLTVSTFDTYSLHFHGIWSTGGEVFLVGDAGAIVHKRR